MMIQLEIIELRTSRKNRKELEDFLARWQEEVKANMKAQQITIYKKRALETDYSIHFRYDPATSEIDFRILSQRLAADLREFGLVNHTRWIEWQ